LVEEIRGAKMLGCCDIWYPVLNNHFFEEWTTVLILSGDDIILSLLYCLYTDPLVYEFDYIERER